MGRLFQLSVPSGVSETIEPAKSGHGRDTNLIPCEVIAKMIFHLTLSRQILHNTVYSTSRSQCYRGAPGDADADPFPADFLAVHVHQATRT